MNAIRSIQIFIYMVSDKLLQLREKIFQGSCHQLCMTEIQANNEGDEYYI